MILKPQPDSKDIICINKKAFFIMAIIIICISFVYFINFFNSQKISTNSQAAQISPAPTKTWPNYALMGFTCNPSLTPTTDPSNNQSLVGYGFDKNGNVLIENGKKKTDTQYGTYIKCFMDNINSSYPSSSFVDNLAPEKNDDKWLTYYMKRGPWQNGDGITTPIKTLVYSKCVIHLPAHAMIRITTSYYPDDKIITKVTGKYENGGQEINCEIKPFNIYDYVKEARYYFMGKEIEVYFGINNRDHLLKVDIEKFKPNI